MNNDQEWRDRLFKEIDGLRKDVAELKIEMHSLKIKVAFFSSAISTIATYIGTKLFG